MGTISHCIDAWNRVDSIQTGRRSSSGKMTIDKWEKYFKSGGIGSAMASYYDKRNTGLCEQHSSSF